MVQQVTIPLSWANNIPGVSGVDDVEFDVPEVEDLVDGVEDAVPDLDDIEQAVEQIVPALDEIVEAIRAEIDDALDELNLPDLDEDRIIDEIQDAVGDAIQDLVLDPEELAEDVIDEIEDALPSVTVNVEEIADAVAERLEDQLDIEAVDPKAIADRILAEGDEFDIQAPGVNIQGVFGPLTEDVVRAFNRILDERIALDEVDLPSVTDVRSAAGEAFLEQLEDLPGGDLLLDPNTFIDDQIDRLLAASVSDESRQALQEAGQETNQTGNGGA